MAKPFTAKSVAEITASRAYQIRARGLQRWGQRESERGDTCGCQNKRKDAPIKVNRDDPYLPRELGREDCQECAQPKLHAEPCDIESQYGRRNRENESFSQELTD